MKCLIFSDSHGSFENMREAVNLHRDAEVIFFLGDGLREADALADEYSDKTFIAVRGNCDFYPYFKGMEAEKSAALRLCDYKITATHGDLYGVKYALGGLIILGRDTASDIILFGHTHTPTLECVSISERALYLFNPGSISSGSFGILELLEKPKFSYGNVRRY